MDGASRCPSMESSHRRLETPFAMERRSRSRARHHSRSRLRSRSPRRNRDQELSSSHERVKLLERQLLQAREHLLRAETRNRSRSRCSTRRTSSRHATQRGERSHSHRGETSDLQRCQAEANRRDGGERSHSHRGETSDLQRCQAEANRRDGGERSHSHRGETSDLQRCQAEANRRDGGERSRSHRGETSDLQRRQAEASRRDGGDTQAEHHHVAGYFKRSRSSSLSKKYIVDVFKCLKDSLTSQPTRHTRSFQKIDHMNILPDFDPSTKNQRIDVWLKKVNECASVYGWDDKTVIHFAMQKLQGLAKTWYEGLNSVLFNWQEWQDKLMNAFPCEQNYCQVLEDMLKRRSRYNEPIEVYFYEKLALLNQCDIVEKRAVDCIIHGISDRTLKSGALALRSSHPDQLLQFLMSSKDSYQRFDRNHNKNKTDNFSTLNSQPIRSGAKSFSGCYNCKERGHGFLHCPKPLIKCTKCNKVGHTVDSCDAQL
ncbi:hypothetical protein PYW08_004267 [Mythimna loreyi]|uniref:Uncharacterized protein n=1 Tax=Mythimna loreyi TaxID=667449 RepID=A0ACC2QPE8_9NEOP|nr:hypothetical protein PYW08_004267 [Mythimna loreyi]